VQLFTCSATFFTRCFQVGIDFRFGGHHNGFTTLLTKLSYESPAWWGLTSAADCDRLEAFLRRSTAFGFRPATAPTLGTICSEADDKLFAAITLNLFHLLHHFLPPRRDTHYSLRPRAHDFALSIRTSHSVTIISSNTNRW